MACVQICAHQWGPVGKHIVSVSLGSRHRDQEGYIRLFGEAVHIARRGSDGDLEAAESMIRALDGHVNAIGLGGIDRYLVVGDRRYEIQDAVRLVNAARSTPVVDGSGVKDTLERTIIQSLQSDGIIHSGQSVLMVSAMDRFGMAETFERLGYRLTAGDLIFSSRINYPIRSAGELAELAQKLLPEMTRMPFHQFYPVGEEQTAGSDPRFARYFEEADIIAGDFHYIRRYSPQSLAGKVVITNTTTSEDVAVLRQKGVVWLVTTTPVVDGRSYGTNVIEAALTAALGFGAEHPEWPTRVSESGLAGTRLALNTR